MYLHFSAFFMYLLVIFILTTKITNRLFYNWFKRLIFLYSIVNILLFQTQFVVDDVSKIIKEAIEVSIGGNAYQHNKVNQWTSNVVEGCLGNLTKLQKPYKYIGMYSYSP